MKHLLLEREYAQNSLTDEHTLIVHKCGVPGGKRGETAGASPGGGGGA